MLYFDDYTSPPFELDGGLEQGCLLSVILYQFYNSPLLDTADSNKGEYTTGNIDDVAVLSVADDFASAHQQLHSFMTRPEGAFEWSRLHNSSFSVEKFGLLNCSHALKSGELGPSLTLDRTTIAPARNYKFLGVKVDHKLSWKAQVDHALDRGERWLTLFRRVAGVKRGIPLRIAKRLYLAVAVPRFLYAADVFLIPPHSASNIGYAIRRLSQIHRQALLIMTGGMKTTPNEIMEAHADILPLRLLIDQICHRATARLCTLPPTHPLYPLVRRAAGRYVKRHRSNLHELFHRYQLKPSDVETIRTARRTPYWKSRFKTEIAKNDDAAEKDDDQWSERPGIRVYTDGSDYRGGVGAAAVLFRDGRAGHKTLRYHLGTSTRHTVYEAELVGIILGMELIRRETRAVHRASIALDNQAVIQASQSDKSTPGHYLLDWFHKTRCDTRRNKHPQMQLTIRWVPGHMGIARNEIADEEAKRAAENKESSPTLQLPRFLRHAKLPHSVSKIKQLHCTQLTTRAKTDWKSTRYANRIERVDANLPSKAYTKLVDNLPRRHAALLFQLRSGHAPLRAHLSRIGRTDTPLCAACEGAPETVAHYLLACPAQARARHALFRTAGSASRSISQLLSHPKLQRPLFRYIHATKRFENNLGSFRMEPPTQRQKDTVAKDKEKRNAREQRKAHRIQRAAQRAP
ncbi:hypothetical protein NM688_g3131 [Phlebia brevispora]|uniref:Uncharacterized protein n=1 Tax=Phlebia brevispora TaxID=194682 RepID=A0ACC1T6D3_9APHY|nr:hypothetical protein NM688_g3131 [Phlebia brevispora]